MLKNYGCDVFFLLLEWK